MELKLAKERLRLGGTPGISHQTSLLKQGHLKKIVQDHVQVASEDPQGVRLHHLSGQLMPVLSHPHSNKVFLDV